MDLNAELNNMKIGQSKRVSGGWDLMVEYVINMVEHGWIITTIFRDTGQDENGKGLPPVITTELIPFPDDWYEE
jgi:hypothetical protein